MLCLTTCLAVVSSHTYGAGVSEVPFSDSDQESVTGPSGPAGPAIEPDPHPSRGGTGHYWIGADTDGDCHYDNIQDAINQAAALGEAWSTISIRVSDPTSLHEGNTYGISLGDFENVTTLDIVGGYTDCSGSSSGITILDASGNGRVFNISNAEAYSGDPREINLENLDIRNGSTTLAFGGGGILINGTPGRLAVNLKNVTVQNNVSDNSGGGVKVRVRAARDGIGTLLTADNDTLLASNSTNSNGGGIACESLVGSTGTATLIRWGAGPIASNQAENGGAISIENGCSRNFFYNGAFLSGIVNNVALDAGGAIYVAGDDSHLVLRGDSTEGFGNPDWRVDVVGNEAIRGGAVYARDASVLHFLDVNISGNTSTGTGASGAGIVATAGPATVTVGRVDPSTPCDSSSFGRCSMINNNSSDGHGGALLARNNAIINVSQTLIEGNTATTGAIASVSGGSPGTVNLESVLATGNEALDMVSGAHGQIDVRWSTLADNTAARLARAAGPSDTQTVTIHLRSSILRQESGVMIDTNDHGQVNGDCLIGWQDEADAGFASVFAYRNTDPQFVDPGNGDYRPGQQSPAIDYCDDFHDPEFADLDGNERGTPHQGETVGENPGLGDFDIGAYETSWMTDAMFHDRFEGN